MRHSLLLIPLLFVFLLSGCSGESTRNDSQNKATSKPTADDQQVRPLGWLDANGSPSESTASFLDEETQEEVTPGGVVLVDVSSGGAAAIAGLQPGDTIVRVVDRWLPFKEDPSLDLMRLIEEQVSAGQEKIELGLLDGDEIATKTITHKLTSLDDGLPLSVSRYDRALEQALGRLSSLQQENGSFSASTGDLVATLRTSAVAGLALLGGGASADGSPFHDALNKCQQFIADQIDAHTEESTPPIEPDTGTAKFVAAGKSNLDPLTVAYVLQFLAESDVPLLDAVWMKRLSSLLATISANQAASGGWMIAASNIDDASEDESIPADEHVTVDVVGTHATNQVLLALGAIERKGVMSDNGSIANACKYLKEQATARVADGSIDRRTKAALLAGTGAAMIGINCDRNDGFLLGSMKECSVRTADLLEAPTLGLPGVVANALFARAMGNESWIGFHNATKYQWASKLDSKGAFHLRTGSQPLSDQVEPDSEAWSTSHLCMLLAAQSDRLQRLTGQSQSPMMASRDSDGKAAEGKQALTGEMPGLPPGAKVIRLEGGNLDDIKDKLKDMGIELDGANVKMIEAGAPAKE